MTTFYFSPRGTGKQMARILCNFEGTQIDLIGTPLTQDREIPVEEPILVVLPVFAGRIPGVCTQMLKEHLKGSGGPAIAVVAYGNRAYDDALLELSDLLTACKFQVVAAGAFIGRHSLFTQVAQGRPDASDKEKLRTFAQLVADKLSAGDMSRPAVPGNPDYVNHTPGPVALKPSCTDRCMKCQACVVACPGKAIPSETPWVTLEDNCISCGACVFLCPTHARDFRGEAYDKMAPKFAEKCAQRREPEWYL